MSKGKLTIVFDSLEETKFREIMDGIEKHNIVHNVKFEDEEEMKTISDINLETNEGKLLLMAIAKISTESQRDKEPDEILTQIIEQHNSTQESKI